MTATDVFRGEAPADTKPAPDDERFWSVTTIIGVLEKPALIYWSAEQTALAAVQHHDAWRAIEQSSGTDEAVKWLSNARFRKPKGERGAAELGTAVHAACEEYALSGIYPEVDDEVRPYLEQFDQWLQHFQPSYQATEVAVYNRSYGYAGTCDAFFAVDGIRAIVDYKSTKKSLDKQGNPPPAYAETSLQLAGYRFAELAAVWRPRRFEQMRRRYYLLSAEERAAAVPVPEVDIGLCIKITPASCIAYPMECGPEIFEQFLYCIESARWSLEISKRVVGAPLVPPGRTTTVIA